MVKPTIKSTSTIEGDGLKQNHGILECEDYAKNLPDLIDFKGILEYPSIRPKWDDAFASAEIISVKDENHIIAHSKTRSFWPVQARDLVVIFEFEPSETREYNTLIDLLKSFESGYTISAKSVDSDVPHQQGYTRAQLHYATFKLEKKMSNDNDKLKLVIDYRVKSDPKGMIPLKLLGMLSDMVPKNLESIYNYLRDEGAPPTVVMSRFGMVRMSKIEYVEEKSMLKVCYSQDVKAVQGKLCYSLIRVSHEWLNKRKCNSVKIESTCKEVKIDWLIHKEDVYVIFELDRASDIEICPVNSQSPALFLGQSKVAVGDSKSFGEKLQKMGKPSDTKPTRDDAQDFSNELLNEYVKQTMLRSQEYTEYVYPRITNKEKFIMRIPDENHPVGLVFSGRLISVPKGYSVDDYVFCLCSIVNNPYSRRHWDKFFDFSEFISHSPFPFDILPTGNRLKNAGNVKVIKSTTKPIWPVSSRTLYVFLTTFETDDSTCILASSLPHQDLIKNESSNSVVAHLDISMWLFKPTGDDQLLIEYAVKSNPKGEIPHFLLESMAQTFPLQLDNVVNYQNKLGAYPLITTGVWKIEVDHKAKDVIERLIYDCIADDAPTIECIVDLRWANRNSSLNISGTCQLESYKQTSNSVLRLYFSKCDQIIFELAYSKSSRSDFNVSFNGSAIDQESKAVDQELVSHLQRSLECFSTLLSSPQTLVKERKLANEMKIDIDGCLIESFLLSEIQKYCKSTNASVAAVERTEFPHFYRFKPNYYLAVKKLKRQFGMQTFIIVHCLDELALSVTISFCDTFLTRKSHLKVIHDSSIVNSGQLIRDLKRLPMISNTFVYYKSPVSDIVSTPTNTHESFAVPVVGDDYLIKHHEVELENTIIDLKGSTGNNGQLIVPHGKSCEIVFDMCKFDDYCTVVKDKHWMVAGKLRKFWVIDMQQVGDLQVYIRYRKSGHGLYVNGKSMTIFNELEVTKRAYFNLGFLLCLMLTAIILKFL